MASTTLQLLTCMSCFVMNPFPSLSHSRNSCLALPMVFSIGLRGSLLRGEVSGLRPWADRGLPGGRVLNLGLNGTASPLP